MNEIEKARAATQESMMKWGNVCFNCAYCSEHYPSLRDLCDVDNHIIFDVFEDTCDNFLESGG